MPYTYKSTGICPRPMAYTYPNHTYRVRRDTNGHVFRACVRCGAYQVKTKKIKET